MTSAAWILMLATWTILTAFTGYYFYKVLAIPPQKNSNVPRD